MANPNMFRRLGRNFTKIPFHREQTCLTSHRWRTVLRGAKHGEHFLEPADLHAEGVGRDAADVKVLLLEEQLVERRAAGHREVGTVTEVLLGLAGQVRRPVREPQPLHCTHIQRVISVM
jgi:hypothetical protein